MSAYELISMTVVGSCVHDVGFSLWVCPKGWRTQSLVSTVMCSLWCDIYQSIIEKEEVIKAE